VVEPGGEDEEEDDQKGDDVGARSFWGGGHGGADMAVGTALLPQSRS
jgi:hypothetical protein